LLRRPALSTFPPRPPTGTLDHVGVFGLWLFRAIAGFSGRNRFGDSDFP
jgi:hypothetical protein